MSVVIKDHRLYDKNIDDELKVGDKVLYDKKIGTLSNIFTPDPRTNSFQTVRVNFKDGAIYCPIWRITKVES